MNGEHAPQTKTLEKPQNKPDLQEEWQAMSGDLADMQLPNQAALDTVETTSENKQEHTLDVAENTPVSERELPEAETRADEETANVSGDLFATGEEFRNKEGEIAARLSPEPLAEEKKQELLVKSLSDSAKETAEYGEARAAMTPEQKREFDERREYAILHDMQAKNPDAFNQQMAQLPSEKRSGFYAYEKAAVETAQAKSQVEHDEIVEQATKLEDEKDFLILHSLKFSDPGRFEEVFKTLEPKKKGAFDTFEAREGAKMKVNNPEMMIPKLSTDGEKWKVSGELPEEAIASLPPKQPYRTAEQMREAGPDAYQQQQDFVNTIKAEEKPSRWAKVRNFFSRKKK